MTTSTVEAESILAIDVGNVNTRAILFDMVGEQYRLIAVGQALTTAIAPTRDVGVGARQAVEQVQEITGRSLLDVEGHILMPTRTDGSGVDRLVTTSSVGPAMNLVIVGLLDEVSLRSARQLAASTYGGIVESIGLNDHRKMEDQVDAIIQADPDAIIIAGGANEGAARPVNTLVEVVGLACYLMPAEQRPVVLYAGNQALIDQVKTSLEGIAPVQATTNIRPTLGQEDLAPAERDLMQIAEKVRLRKVRGLDQLVKQSSVPAVTSAYGMGRVIRFLSQINDGSKGVLGVDLGASATVTAAARCGQLRLNVSPFGLGEGILHVLDQVKTQEIAQWLPFSLPESALRDFIHQKALFPEMVPFSLEEQAIEQAIARVILRQVTKGLVPPAVNGSKRNWSAYEPILASGSVLTQAPSPAKSLLMLLDGLQPAGITTFVLDQNNLIGSLGAAAAINPYLPVQILESGALLYLGTVISPLSSARLGATILEVKLVREDGSETEVEIKQGSLNVLPVPQGQPAQLLLDPVNHTQVGMSKPGRGIKVTGGVLGVVIDARGRPLNLDTDPARRQETLKKWDWALNA